MKSKEKKVFLLIGIPGSGKSTFVNNLKQDKVIISRDEIRFSLLKDEDDYFKYEKEVFNIFIKKINEAIKDPEGPIKIFVDATHLNYKSRMKVLNKLDLTNALVYAIYFDIPLEICQERNSKRTGRAKVPAETITSMYSSLAYPDEEEEKIYTGIYIVRRRDNDLSY